jgi:DNA repair protein RecN (Recombination protein N)
MLLNVHIKNIALIDDANVNFNDRLNILTGETGAGKSIIMGALKIGTGEKLQKDIVRDSSKEGLCQLLFVVEDEDSLAKLSELGISASEDGEVLLTRRITGGKTINTINDMTVTASKLKEASSILLDMHSQHQQQSLLKRQEHLNLVDKFGKDTLEPLKEQMKLCFKEYRTLKEEWESLSLDEGERARQQEYLIYQINEIEVAALKEGEDEETEKLFNRMRNSKDIVSAADNVYSVTGYDRVESAGNGIGRALMDLKAVRELDEDVEGLYSQLETVDALLNDFNVELNNYMQSMEFDQEEFDTTLARLDVINDIKGKYGRTIPEVMEYLEKTKKECERLEGYEEYVSELSEKLNTAKKNMCAAAEKLSEERKKTAQVFCEKIRESLADLSFMQVKFDMVFEKLNEPTANGFDDCYFIISTNVGEKPRPLQNVASGGELSRIMLAIKSCMAGKDNIGTMIFDEIDVGISGMAAQKVAEKMACLAKNCQIICITHLPQIAAMADSHYLIEKSVNNGKTVTTILPLNEEASVAEVARLLGGATITDTVIENAKEMKQMAKTTKNN